MATATVTRKGQVTIPKAVRDRNGLKPGNKVDFALNDAGSIVITKSSGEKPKGRFEALRGTLDLGMTTDEFMTLMRGEE